MKIPSRARKCCVDEKPLEGGSRYLSMLNEEGERLDYCEACASTCEKLEHHWWGTIPTKETEVITPDEKLLQRLRLFSEKKEPLAYLLALYLDRLGMIERRSKYLFEVASSGETFRLKPGPISSEDEQLITELVTTSA